MASEPNDPARNVPKSPGLRSLYNRYVGTDPERVASFDKVMAEERARYERAEGGSSALVGKLEQVVVVDPESILVIAEACSEIDRLRAVVAAFGIEPECIDLITPAEAAQVREQWQDDWGRASRDSADLDNLRRDSAARIARMVAENAELIAMLKTLVVCVGGEYGQFATQARAANRLIEKATVESTGGQP